MTNLEIENHLITLFIDSCGKFFFKNIEDIQVIKSERPDFILKDVSSLIGVEITRSLNQNLQKTFRINKQYFDSRLSICPSLFEVNEQMSKDLIIDKLEKSKEKIIGKPYLGNDLENAVSKMIVNSIQKKQIKFEKYKKFNKNILLIHTEMRPTLDINIIAESIDKYIQNNHLTFDYLFIKLSNYFLHFSNTQFIEYITIHNND